MKKTTTAFIIGSALILGSACASPERGDGTGDGDGSGDGDGDGDGSGDPGTTQRCNKMDLVFVVDDSNSMVEEQSNLASNFPVFADVLMNFVDSDGNQLDFRIAVTTTGKTVTTTTAVPGLPPISITEEGANGAFRTNCGVNRAWLEPTDDLSAALPCRANVGVDGPGTEMPLYATQLALKDRMADGTNTGFVRPDALLGVVMLTDEDDSSSTATSVSVGIGGSTMLDYNPADLVGFLDQYKGNRTKWATGVIAGQTACNSSLGMAAEATRLKDFVNLSNNGATQQGVFSSICDANMAAALTQVVDKFQNACGAIIL